MASKEQQDQAAAQAAANAQLQAMREALAFLREQYSQQREDQAPFTKIGGGAVNKLGYLMGIQGYQPLRAGGPGSQETDAGGRRGGPFGLPPQTGAGGSDPAGSDWPVPDSPRRRGPIEGGYASSPLALIAGTTAPSVRLRAPTGETRSVPADQVDQYLARGAQRI